MSASSALSKLRALSKEARELGPGYVLTASEVAEFVQAFEELDENMRAGNPRPNDWIPKDER
jgi:hypothetical protein